MALATLGRSDGQARVQVRRDVLERTAKQRIEHGSSLDHKPARIQCSNSASLCEQPVYQIGGGVLWCRRRTSTQGVKDMLKYSTLLCSENLRSSTCRTVPRSPKQRDAHSHHTGHASVRVNRLFGPSATGIATCGLP